MTTFRNLVLLTGAGFTANFGGFLAKEMWSKIFNNPKLSNAGNVKLELKKSFDFEAIYSRVFDNRAFIQPNEAVVFEDVLNDAYLALDKSIKEPDWAALGIQETDLRRFLDYFRTSEDGKTSACFTLNQDLFLERSFGWQPLLPPSLRYKNNFGTTVTQDIDPNNTLTLPTQGDLDTYKSTFSESFVYVKLHGSQSWVTSDGKATKVLGVNKVEAIQKIPLLNWYFQLFQEALNRQAVKLVVIGYSFNDDHINQCIVNAVNGYGLKMYVVSPEVPSDFSFRLNNKYPKEAMMNDQDTKRQPIWKAVEGYFPYRLKDFFPYPQRFSHEREEFYKALSISIS